jgi:hypothetical protein
MNRILSLLLVLALSGCGTDVAGPAGALLSCGLGSPASIAVGGALQVQGEANHDVCLTSAPDVNGSFIFVPFYGARPADDDEPRRRIDLEISATGTTGAGVVSLAGAATAPTGAPVLLGAADALRSPGARPYRPDREFHDRLRRREIAELEPRIRPGATGTGGAPAQSAVTAPLPAVGDLLTYNTATSCTARNPRTGRVMYVSDHAIVVADTATPVDLGPEDYAYFGITFDTLVYPVETAHFGEPADIDGNGRSVLFFTPAVNARNPREAESVIIGFFWSGDLFPPVDTERLQGCPESNQAEIFYLIAPDPTGEIGPTFTLDRVRDLAIPLIGHEFQHLVNASRRLFVNGANVFEETWLNEGLSHIAEELLFYEAAGLETGRNLTADEVRNAPGGVAAFNEYVAANFGNLHEYLARPDTASLMGRDRLSTRGAAWAFLRYAADRKGAGDEAFFRELVNTREAGLDNLTAALAPASPLDWMRDWTVALYGDDLVPGIPERFQTLSWDLRDVFTSSSVGFYPLTIRDLPEAGTVNLQAGGAVFYAFGIPAGDRALIRGTVDDDLPPDGLRGSFLRIR